MPFDIGIPLSSGGALTFSIDPGQILFVLGANGAGKSSMMQRLYTSHRHVARRISAHRQTWFSSNTIAISARERKQLEEAFAHGDVDLSARWREHNSEQRANVAIYDLVDAENIRARGIATAVDRNDFDLAKELAKKDAPVKIINDLLSLSNMPIEIAVREAEQVVASRNGGAPYSISELSDGERNALLLAANVLTAPVGMIMFIDEPERHLHRSIIAPLLTLLFEQRPDCAFVVSTHDVMLPLDNPTSRTLLVRGCNYDNPRVITWDADLMASDESLDDDIKRDILGGRRKLLFVEGDEQSLDKPLYQLLFPEVTVIPKSSCRDVEHTVTGIRDAASLHWVNAFGIVDNDRRTPQEIERLRLKGVIAVPAFSVESLYYHPDIQRRLAARQHALTGADPDLAVRDARAATVAAVAQHRQRLCERVAEAALRQEMLSKLPKRANIAASQPIEVRIDVAAVVAEELARFDRYCREEDLDSIIARYPIRETGALGIIADRLGFKSRRQYEEAVRKLLMDNREALLFLRGLFGALASEIESV